MLQPFERLLAAPRGEPVALLHSCGRGPVLFCSQPVAVLSVPAGAAIGALSRLEEFLREHVARRCVGWLGYDLGLDVEAWPLRIAEDFPVPVLHVTAFDRVETFAAQAVPQAPAVERARALCGHTTRVDYERRVAAVVEHIRAGDLFQANLTQPFTGTFGGDPRLLFWRLCAESPAPFSAYLEDGRGTAVLSSSPEEFLWRERAMVRTRPIKGTRPRHADALIDRGLLEELLASEKDQAELAMIVDLMRNDLGKVAEAGSVQVGPFPEHDSFAQVHHLLCTVTARLLPGIGPVDLLRATFPPGSVTGCPKLRCLEILEELELGRRGVYTGAIGWFGPGEELHLNVAIRTMVVREGRVRGNAGGGITAQSEPRREFEETLHKMAGLERALQCAVEIPGQRR
jgi:para-aminobenzoate synthetase component 1